MGVIVLGGEEKKPEKKEKKEVAQKKKLEETVALEEKVSQKLWDELYAAVGDEGEEGEKKRRNH